MLWRTDWLSCLTEGWAGACGARSAGGAGGLGFVVLT